MGELRTLAHQCSKCGRVLPSQNQLEEHMKTVHKEAPAPFKDKAVAHGHLSIVLRGPDGKVKETREVDNLITTVGRNAIWDQLEASPANAKPSHMAIGTGTNAAAAGDTTLQTELDRNALTSKSVTANVATMVGDWAAGDGTGAITEAGILNAGSGGDLYSRAVFSVINKAAGDTLSITWTWTFTIP